MGSSKSVITALETVLKQRDIRIANRTLKNFVKEIDRVAPWYPGQFRITDPCLMEQTSSDDSESSKDEVLDTDEEAKLDEEAARYEEERYHPDDHIQNSKEPRKRQLQTAFSQVVPSAPPPYETCPKSYSFIPEKVKRKLRLAFPVFEGLEGEYMRPWNILRLALNAMTPSDWQMVAKAALVSMGQYMEWKALWHEAAQEQARSNSMALTPEQQQWTFNLLTGQGHFAADQTNYHWGAYQQVTSSAIRAWKVLSKKGGVDNQLTKIIQGTQEPFSDFVARMTEAAGRIFGDSEQAMPLIEQLVFEQATQECRTAIAPRKNIGLQDWLRVCRELGGPLTNAGLAAAILQSQKRPLKGPDKRTCFRCGKAGHLRKDCKMSERERDPPTLCTRCGKGYHKAAQCRSVRDIKGRILPPMETPTNEIPKNGAVGPQSQGPLKYGNRSARVTDEPPPPYPGDGTRMDLRAASDFLLMPQMGVQPVPVQTPEPLPKGSIAVVTRMPRFVPVPVETPSSMMLFRERRDFGISAIIVGIVAATTVAASVTASALALSTSVQTAQTINGLSATVSEALDRQASTNTQIQGGLVLVNQRIDLVQKLDILWQMAQLGCEQKCHLHSI
ncbi:hypothetical protein NN561_018981 [Cricetulus griseus]